MYAAEFSGGEAPPTTATIGVELAVDRFVQVLKAGPWYESVLS
jgi:hypothetical protein